VQEKPIFKEKQTMGHDHPQIVQQIFRDITDSGPIYEWPKIAANE
jgi:hypothetical protein